MSKPLHLELFFIDGNPNGMLTARVFGWCGQILVLPRTKYLDAKKRKEFEYTGVYILLGEDEDGQTIAYIGEADDISERIKAHNKDSRKDWWTKAVIITYSDDKFTKAHARYLESRLINLGHKAQNIDLQNGTNPTVKNLGEENDADMEGFIEQLLMILPAVQVDMFVNNVIDTQNDENDNPEFELSVPTHSVLATAKLLENGQFVVQQGSVARGECRKNLSYSVLYEHLVRTGVLVQEGDNKIFTESYAFSSTSAAGAVCTGRSTQGTVAWKVKGTQLTYRDWEKNETVVGD